MHEVASAPGPKPEHYKPDDFAPEELDNAVKVLRLFHGEKSRKRRAEAHRRWLVYSENFEPLVCERILKIQHDESIREELAKFVDVTANPGLDIARQICVVWKHGARRMIRDKDKAKRRMQDLSDQDDAKMKGSSLVAPEPAADKPTDSNRVVKQQPIEFEENPEQEAFQKLVTESMLDSLLPELNRLALLCGPVLVFPVIRGKRRRMQFDVVLPHQYEVLQDPDDPHGEPLAACWELFDINDPHQQDPRMWSAEDRPNFLVVDHRGWHYFDTRAGIDNPKRIRSERHAVGEFPGASLRLWRSFDESWHGHFPHKRLIDGTISVGFINTTAGFVRKSQCKKLLYVKGDLEEAPKRQVLDPEGAARFDVQSPHLIDFNAIDFDTSPNNFITHALWVYQSLAEAYGAQSVSMAANSSTSNFMEGRFQFSHDALTEVRNEQIPFCRAFEHDLAVKMVAVARGSKPTSDDDNGIGGKDPPDIVNLPDPEKVRESFTVEFPKLARTYADPRQRADDTDWLISKGSLTQLDVLRWDNPTLTDDQLLDLLLQNLEVQSKVNDIKASRNMPNDGESVTAPEAQGRMGPKIRDGEMPPTWQQGGAPLPHKT